MTQHIRSLHVCHFYAIINDVTIDAIIEVIRDPTLGSWTEDFELLCMTKFGRMLVYIYYVPIFGCMLVYMYYVTIFGCMLVYMYYVTIFGCMLVYMYYVSAVHSYAVENTEDFADST